MIERKDSMCVDEREGCKETEYCADEREAEKEYV